MSINYIIIALDRQGNMNGKTAAEKCGINIVGNDNLLTLIRNASRRQ